MAKSRYVGGYPVTGIRPIVDGRRGPMMLRESLEPLVWSMAEAAKKLFEENLFYSNGEPVKVVMADTTIIYFALIGLILYVVKRLEIEMTARSIRIKKIKKGINVR